MVSGSPYIFEEALADFEGLIFTFDHFLQKVTAVEFMDFLDVPKDDASFAS